jgi:hypothetical protein
VTLLAPALGLFFIKMLAQLCFSAALFPPRHHDLAAYECELIGLSQAVRHCRPYLWGRSFIVKTDHQPLKYILD